MIAHEQKMHQALQRLQAISWEYNIGRIKSYVALMWEYLRRSALWMDTLQLDSTKRGPFFDVVEELKPDVQVPQALVNKIQAPGGLVVEHTCIKYLRWVAVEEQPEVQLFQLPAPYEPLIRLFERGGTFRVEHNLFIDFIGAAIPLHNWYTAAKRTTPIALDDASLDAIDAADPHKPV